MGFFLREALKNMRLNLLMSLTAITTTFICLLVLGTALLVSGHVEGLISAIRKDVSVEAFFQQDAPQEEIDQVRSNVEGYPEVSQVTYVSKDEAVEKFKNTLQDRPDLVSDLGSDFLPASLQIQLEDPGSADDVARKLEGEGSVIEDIDYPQRTVERLTEVTDYVVWGLRGATALFLVSSVLLISNTIRISIFARRKEIEVMKLVGASDSFVRTPFVFEGLAQGVIGAVIAGVAVVWLNSLFVEWAANELPFVPISGDSVNMLAVVALLLVAGAVIGILGSFLSVSRFLKI
ncbi:MAG TPA: permease-like cell division protein FtsX [Rubrobacteraceae bacterium]|nr:permease-like cell division protein FtsX [Rubrobacteraceae bacterium]